MTEVEVVVAHTERATLRVGEVFLKVDSDPGRTDAEVKAMALAPVPTPTVLWRHPPVLALAAAPGAPLGRLGRPSSSSPAAWTAAGAAVRRLHDTPPPPRPRHDRAVLRTELAAECAWLLEHQVLPAEVVHRNRHLAEAALQPFTPVFVHGDLQIDHVFVVDDEVSAVLDWSEAGAGDRHHDLATLTLGHRDHLDDVLAGYGTADVDRDAVRGWWSLRSLLAIRWLAEHGFDPTAPGCEIDVLTSQAATGP